MLWTAVDHEHTDDWEGYFSGHARSSSGKAWDAANKQLRLRFHVRNRPCMCRQQWANRQITKKIMFNFIVSTETCIFQICSLTHWLLTYWLIWLIKHPFSSVRFDISLQNFKKPLFDISPRTERKKLSEEYLLVIFAAERKLWAIFLSQVHLWKQQTAWSRQLKTLQRLPPTRAFEGFFSVCFKPEFSWTSINCFHGFPRALTERVPSSLNEGRIISNDDGFFKLFY